jgi:hypothetical protein
MISSEGLILGLRWIRLGVPWDGRPAGVERLGSSLVGRREGEEEIFIGSVVRLTDRSGEGPLNVVKIGRFR